MALASRSTDAMRRPVTLGADKGYDIGDSQVALAEEGVVPHVAQKQGLAPLVDGRTSTRRGYRMSQRKSKRVEEIFGWAKTVAGMAKTRFRGALRVGAQLLLAMTTYNLVLIPRLELQTG